MPRLFPFSALLLCSLFGSQSLAADSRFDKVNITPVKLSEHSYMSSGAGGNIGVSVG
ncbi:hypothetical protein LZP69_07325 [Shewanella sp. AS1]|uniref:hypothetical protein n=1 Tax=Shewanella sp. AS1 TaxID=2907626 RepID=UPI001F30847E|nr:hypothetical protein [Shewanella sp. AS1]MCE9678998.1 hypothetical protein [Shewanella sp. AS1]